MLCHACEHGLLSMEEIKRWYINRDNSNNTIHDYGEGFAHEALVLMPAFVNDARNLEALLRPRLGSLMPTLDLPRNYLHTLVGLLQAYTSHAEVWTYGSCASVRAHETSDPDLVIRNLSDLYALQKMRVELRAAISDSNLPILVDVMDWA